MKQHTGIGSLRTWARRRYENISLRNVIWFSFTITAVLAALLMGLSFYSRTSRQFKDRIQEENQALIEQVNNTLSNYLRNMMKVSDSLYYSVIKSADLAQGSILDQMQLLYDTNKDSIETIALFSLEGDLLEAAPASTPRKTADPGSQEWLLSARAKTENLHFSQPRVQNLFVGKEDQYSWVIALSRVVQLSYGSRTEQGVLLIDLRYIGLEDIMSNAVLGNKGYIYLIDADGSILYHPKHQLIHSGYLAENNLTAAAYRDGNHEEIFQGKTRTITIKSVGYTGWRIVGVTPQEGLVLSTLKSNLFFAFLLLFFFTILILINSYISAKVSNPIRDMEESVKMIEEGNLDICIQSTGCYEVRHLGDRIQKMAVRIRQLMQDIVAEHESKRKSELDTLQSQINPHFLYNTLDVIVWMIENERRSEAVQAVTALARFFRISLSKGKHIIPLSDELEHVENYLMIQKMRYKNKFTYHIQAPEDAKGLAVMKLMLQPLVENAIYHAMEYMDGDGEILISARRQEDDLILEVEDNGSGMLPKIAGALLEREVQSSRRKGSGIGVKNVHERIRLQYGEGYGLAIHSEPDEGTRVTIRLPAAVYTGKEA